MARVLSIDYGIKRCGIAVTDPLQIIVNGLAAISQLELFDFVTNYCAENQVEKIVIGYPLQADGTKTKISDNIELLKMNLESKLMHIKVELIDEHKSSQQAMKVMVQSGMGKKKRSDKSILDKMSAVIILQRYLGHI